MACISGDKMEISSQCANCLETLTDGKKRIQGKYDRSEVPILDALSLIYGFPLDKGLISKTGEKWWTKQDECELCSNCSGVVTLFYQAFQELRMLAQEASHISQGIMQFHKCVQKHFLEQGKPKFETIKRFGKTYEKKPRKKLQNIPVKESNVEEKLDSNENATIPQNEICPNETENVVPSDENVEAEVHDEFNPSIVKVETVLSEENDDITTRNKLQNSGTTSQTEEQNVPKEEAPCAGSREIISGNRQPIRMSTRTRKVKTPSDLGAGEPKRSKRKGKVIPELVPINDTIIANNASEPDLWQICNDLYYKGENLDKLPDGKFVCPDVNCGKAFKILKTLNKHALTHDLPRPYRCVKCDLVFENRLEIRDHFNQIHASGAIKMDTTNSISETVPPTTSAKSGKSQAKVKPKNPKQIETPKEFKCEHCDKKFLLKTAYNKHLTIHKETGALCRCTVCNQTYPTAISLARHIKSIHDGEVDSMDPSVHDKGEDASDSGKPFRCDKCNKEFKKLHQFNMHVLFHNDAIPRFGCSKCPKQFFQPELLRKHLLIHTLKNPLVCSHCEKCFERQDHLQRHVDMVHNEHKEKVKRKTRSRRKKADEIGEDSHRCPECKKTFTRKEYLRLHMRIHTGEKPHICHTCGKQFRDPRNLVQHMVTHTSDRPFCCSVCGLTFKRGHHLNDHESTHRQDVARPFVCPAANCGKAFKLRKHLVSHELVHTGRKDETCHVCGRSFSRKDNLRQHINKIHGKKQAEDLLSVLEEQREKLRNSQVEEQEDSDESNSMEEFIDPVTEALTAVILPDSCTTVAHQVVQIIQPQVVATTLTLPLAPIVTPFSTVASFARLT